MVAKLGEGVLRKGDRASGQTGGQMGVNSSLVGGARIVLLARSANSVSDPFSVEFNKTVTCLRFKFTEVKRPQTLHFMKSPPC